MEKVKLIFARVISILSIGSLVAFLFYEILIKPIIQCYHEYGTYGIYFAIIVEIVFYTLAYFVLKLIFWAINYSFK